MDNPFSASFFSGNRRALFERVQAKIIVVPANCVIQRSGDTTFPFRQDSSFWYLTGVKDPDCTLVITKTSSYIISPTRSKVQAIFDGAINLAAIKKQSGVDEVLPYREGWTKLKRQLKAGTVVGFPLPSTQLARAHSFALNPGRRLVLQKLRRYRSDLKVTDIRLELAHLRSIKQPEELIALQRAINITTQTFKEVFKHDWYRYYKKEYEVEAAITAGFRKRGADDHAYSPIIAADKNATTLHYIENNSELSSRGLLLIDAGAEINGYAADITRVVPMGAKYTARQKQVLQAVADVQKHAMTLLKPGIMMREYEQAVEQYMGEALQNLGLIKRLTRKNIRKYYPHATSHMLGLDVHDAADYTQPLAENMVITVEPGVYIPAEKIGIRLEDDVLITKSGAKVLSASLPLDITLGYNKT